MKYYYSISDVSKTTGVKPYVLRYWEQEFKELHPRKTKGGRREYTKKDIDLIFFVKKLLYEERYSIEGARKKLKNNKESSAVARTPVIENGGEADKNIFKKVEQGLKEILDILK